MLSGGRGRGVPRVQFQEARMQRGGGAGGTWSSIPLCRGLTESADFPVCRVPSSVGEGLAPVDAVRKQSRPASWRKVDLSL